MLCVVPALRALRAALPEAHVALVGLPSAEQFTQRFAGYIDEFIAFPGHPLLPEQPVRQGALAPFYLDLCTRRFALALQMHGGDDVCNDIVSGFGAQVMAGFCRGPGVARAHTQLFPYPAVGTESERLLGLMERLGAEPAGADLEFPVSQADEDALAACDAVAGLSPRTYFCIHPGARERDTCWPPPLFAEAGDRIASEFGLQPVLTAANGEADRTAEVAAHMRHAPVIAANALPIGPLAALLRDARLLLCNDGCVSDLAAALRTRSVVVFHQPDIARRAPLDRHAHRCIWDPDGARIQSVLQHARALLDGTAPSRQRCVGMWPYW